MVLQGPASVDCQPASRNMGSTTKAKVLELSEDWHLRTFQCGICFLNDKYIPLNSEHLHQISNNKKTEQGRFLLNRLR